MTSFCLINYYSVKFLHFIDLKNGIERASHFQLFFSHKTTFLDNKLVSSTPSSSIIINFRNLIWIIIRIFFTITRTFIYFLLNINLYNQPHIIILQAQLFVLIERETNTFKLLYFVLFYSCCKNIQSKKIIQHVFWNHRRGK